MCVWTYKVLQACGSQEQLAGVTSPLLCGFQGSNSDHQAWQQMLLLSPKPSHWPYLICILHVRVYVCMCVYMHVRCMGAYDIQMDSCVCLPMCMSVGTHVPWHICGNLRTASSVSPHLPPCLLPAAVAKLAGCQASSVCFSFHHRNAKITWPALPQCWDPNSGCPACMASTLSTEPSAHPSSGLLFFIHLAISLSRKKALPVSRQCAD